ncbi:hypothetical protein LJC35_05635 [Parabacteroides sp. OttesenSCG-928-N08]|nr:hypothetical protein [Parabacteroides sp. OttesenSCG-928-N08]
MTACSKRLLVEGNNDQHVLSALCHKYQIPENFEIVDCKGINGLKRRLPLDFKTSDIDTIGVILDADTDIHARWDSIRNIVSQAGFVFPETLPSTGLILTNEANGMNFGLWIMPDNKLNGMLEDFVHFLIPPSDPLKPIVHETLDRLENNKLNPYSLTHKSKAFIHTWLAWQKKPGTPMGAAITQQYLTTDVDQCRLLVNWLTSLFSD